MAENCTTKLKENELQSRQMITTIQSSRKVKRFTDPGPSVHGPPTNAIIRAPFPNVDAPSNPAATLNATPVHLKGLFPGATGH